MRRGLQWCAGSEPRKSGSPEDCGLLTKSGSIGWDSQTKSNKHCEVDSMDTHILTYLYNMCIYIIYGCMIYDVIESYILIWTRDVYFQHINWWPQIQCLRWTSLVFLADDFVALPRLTPDADYMNFDNILWALLVVFQCMTMEGKGKKHPFKLAALRWESGHEMERGHWNNGTLQNKIRSSTFIDVENGAKLPGWTDIMYRVQDSYDFIAWKTCGDGGMVWIGTRSPIFFGNSLSLFGMGYAMSILWEQEDPYYDYSTVCVCRLSIQGDVMNFLWIWYEWGRFLKQTSLIFVTFLVAVVVQWDDWIEAATAYFFLLIPVFWLTNYGPFWVVLQLLWTKKGQGRFSKIYLIFFVTHVSSSLFTLNVLLYIPVGTN